MFGCHDTPCVVRASTESDTSNRMVPSPTGEQPTDFSHTATHQQHTTNKLTFAVDENPTPSRYIDHQYTCEGLPFEDVYPPLNPFEEQFRRASQARAHQPNTVEGSSHHFPGNSASRFNDSSRVSIRPEDDNESLDTPRIIPPTPVDSDQTISSTSRDELQQQQQHCRTLTIEDSDCSDPINYGPHSSSYRVSSSLLNVGTAGKLGHHPPTFRSLSELSARVAGREMADDTGRLRISRQNTTEIQLEEDDPEEEDRDVVACDADDRAHQYRCSSEAPVDCSRNRSRLTSIDSCEVQLCDDSCSNAGNSSNSSTPWRSIIIEQQQNNLPSSTPGSCCSNDDAVEVGVEGRDIASRRHSSGSGRAAARQHRLSINVTSAVEAGRTTGSIISTPTPVITHGPSITQCHKEVTVTSVEQHRGMSSALQSDGSRCRQASGSRGIRATPIVAPIDIPRATVLNGPQQQLPPTSPSAIVLQLYVRLPNGQPMPLEIPATTLLPTDQQTSAATLAKGPVVASITPAPPAPTTLPPVSSAQQQPSFAKMRLKEALTSSQKAAKSIPRCHPSRAHTAHRIATMTRTQNHPQQLNEGLNKSLNTASPMLESPVSNIIQKVDTDKSNEPLPSHHHEPPSFIAAQNILQSGISEEEGGGGLVLNRGRKRSITLPNEDVGDKRQKFLERNRAAAVRCREKKKEWVQKLVVKSSELANVNGRLQAEVMCLRSEVAGLKSLLLKHSSCSVTLAEREAGDDIPSKDENQLDVKRSADAARLQSNNTSVVSSLPMISIPSDSIKNFHQQASDTLIGRPVNTGTTVTSLGPNITVFPAAPSTVLTSCAAASVLPTIAGSLFPTVHQQQQQPVPGATILTSQSILAAAAATGAASVPHQASLVSLLPMPPVCCYPLTSIPPNTSHHTAIAPAPPPPTLTAAQLSSRDLHQQQLTLTSLASSLQCLQSSLTSSTKILTAFRQTSAMDPTKDSRAAALSSAIVNTSTAAKIVPKTIILDSSAPRLLLPSVTGYPQTLPISSTHQDSHLTLTVQQPPPQQQHVPIVVPTAHTYQEQQQQTVLSLHNHHQPVVSAAGPSQHPPTVLLAPASHHSLQTVEDAPSTAAIIDDIASIEETASPNLFPASVASSSSYSPASHCSGPLSVAGSVADNPPSVDGTVVAPPSISSSGDTIDASHPTAETVSAPTAVSSAAVLPTIVINQASPSPGGCSVAAQNSSPPLLANDCGRTDSGDHNSVATSLSS